VELANAMPLSKFVNALGALNLKIEDMQFEPDGAVVADARAMVFTLKAHKKENRDELLQKIKETDGVIRLEEI